MIMSQVDFLIRQPDLKKIISDQVDLLIRQQDLKKGISDQLDKIKLALNETRQILKDMIEKNKTNTFWTKMFLAWSVFSLFIFLLAAYLAYFRKHKEDNEEQRTKPDNEIKANNSSTEFRPKESKESNAIDQNTPRIKSVKSVISSV